PQGRRRGRPDHFYAAATRHRIEKCRDLHATISRPRRRLTRAKHVETAFRRKRKRLAPSPQVGKTALSSETERICQPLCPITTISTGHGLFPEPASAHTLNSSRAATDHLPQGGRNHEEGLRPVRRIAQQACLRDDEAGPY